MVSVREYFAAHAIGPVYADLARNAYEEVDFDTIARLSFALADKMLLQSTSSGEKSPTFQFSGWANLFPDGDIGIIHRSKDELALHPDEAAQVVRVYIEHDRTDKAS